MTKTLLKFGFILASAAALFMIEAPKTASAQSFAGKTIEVIVPSGAGGGLTRNARRFTKNLSKHIPGNPNVIVKNIVGGGGQKGINFIYQKGKKDGTQILFGPLNLIGINMGLPGIRYDPAKFKILGTSGGFPFITIVRSDIGGGIKNREDFASKSGFVTGGRIPGGNLGLFSRMPLAILGIENRFVVGYKGQPKLKAALLQNEIQALTTGNPGYWALYIKDTLKKGQAIALYQHPSIDSKTGKFRKPTHVKGVPYFTDYYRKVRGGEPSGDAWDALKWFSNFMTYTGWMVMHPDTPDNITALLRKSFIDNWKDPSTQASFIKGNKMSPIVVPGLEAQKLASNFKNMPAGAKRYFAKEFGIAKASKKKKKK
jgi:hypothetical protein